MRWSDWLQERHLTPQDCYDGDLYYLLKETIPQYVMLDNSVASGHYLKADLLSILNDRYDRLLAQEPLAYILGTVPFLDLDFTINNHVLIPRSATEEWVHRLLQQEQDKELKVLDIGTGSGCIAVTLSYYRSHWDMWGCDISQHALDVARNNSARHKTTIQWALWDLFMLSHYKPRHTWDIIVTNPPYLTESEWEMVPSLAWEPKSALVDSTVKALACYTHVIAYSAQSLRPGGRLYMEHGSQQRQDICAIAKHSGLKVRDVWKDSAGHDRVVVCEK